MKILDQSCRRSESILAIFKGKLYCPAHHPHDNTYVLLQEKPVRLWTGFALYIFAEHFGLSLLLTYLLILFLFTS
jgi:hypothetical protein